MDITTKFDFVYILGAICVAAPFSTYWLTGLIRKLAIKQNIMDVPNDRSSHDVPVPRGGGISIVTIYLLILFGGALAGILMPRIGIALIGGGFSVAVIGWLDDRGHIPAIYRLVVHFLAAGWIVSLIGGLPPIHVFGSEFDLGMMGNVLLIMGIVWLLNLYNFMDGINGIASIETITVAISGAILTVVSQSELVTTFWLPILLAFSVAGFVVWNFPVARIFMGDAGSGFLGIILAGLAILALHDEPSRFWSWLTLLAVFIADASLTLFRRFLRKKSLHEAHRSHAYQYAARRYGSHTVVTLGVAVINLVWLLPLAIMIELQVMDPIIGLLAAYTPILGLAFYFKAGAEELQATAKRRN